MREKERAGGQKRRKKDRTKRRLKCLRRADGNKQLSLFFVLLCRLKEEKEEG